MRLKRLVVIGFKSFADRTELDLDVRLTGLVGPNGCGKSNVVDAVRWVLGEQRARQLRGREMADVIFGGTNTRKPTGYAECSLTIGNDDRRIAMDCDEVVVTRRLYRSGESEYLLNKEPVRLKDIRRLLRGTGMGMNAYSIIEQGKVDQLLMASAKERRLVFEEAAGISQFKAQRRECELKLQRTEQNLLRVGDVIDEVEKQLRSVKYQAAKARRYKAHTARLKELQARLSLGDYGRLLEAADAAEAEVAELAQAAERLHRRRQELAEQARRSEAELNDLDAALRAAERAEIERDGQVTRACADADHQTDAAQRLVRQADEHDRRAADAQERLQTVNGRRDQLRAAAINLTTEIQQQEGAIRTAEQELKALADALDQQLADVEEAKTRGIEILRRTSRVQNELGAVAGLKRTLAAQIDRETARRDDLAARLDGLRREAADAEITARDRAERLAALQHGLAVVDAQRRRWQEALSADEAALVAARERLSALTGRRAVLVDLETRLAGVGRAVKALVERADDASGMRGLVADLVRAPRDYARAVEAVLGAAADYVVVDSRRHALDLTDEMARQDDPPTDAVGFLCRDRVRPIITDVASPAADSAHTGVVGDLLDLIDVEPAARAVVATLLAGTVVVRDMPTALAVTSNGLANRQVVTLAGDVIAPDGRLLITGAGRTQTAGDAPPAAPESGGRIWRRAEIEHLTAEIADVERTVSAHEAACTDARARITRIAERHASIETEIDAVEADLGAARNALERCRQQIDAAADEVALLDSEIAAARDDLTEAEARHTALTTDLATLEGENERLRADVARRETAIQDHRAHLAERREALSGVKAALTETRTRRDEANANLAVAERDVVTWQQAHDQAVEAAQTCRDESAAARRAAEDVRTRITEMETERVGLAERRQAAAEKHHDLSRQRTQVAAERDQAVEEHDELTQRLQERRVAAGEIRVKREDLVERTRDELGMDLAALFEQAAHQEPHAEAAQQSDETENGDAPAPESNDPDVLRTEIADLRGKIERLGGVNMEALDELDELEQRAIYLNKQRDDLVTAKTDLERVIRKINKECRERFATTFEQIRTHFQELFRKLFGGGKADIFLERGEGEEEIDILESGIEIVARPPGKEPQTLTLLSGGEKVMTAVGILLAIFRSNPSPFCILDEVDAALDESAIGRFVHVLQDFLDLSQFIIVTHNKATMAAAHVLYGVTMREPGVSKVMTMHLDDVENRIAQPRVA